MKKYVCQYTFVFLYWFHKTYFIYFYIYIDKSLIVNLEFATISPIYEKNNKIKPKHQNIIILFEKFRYQWNNKNSKHTDEFSELLSISREGEGE